jgi:tellurite resistance-related uncharacterized protein
MLWRIATAPEFVRDSYATIRDCWSFTEVLEAHVVLDALEDARTRARERAESEAKNKARQKTR